jgi:hypothetical protein
MRRLGLSSLLASLATFVLHQSHFQIFPVEVVDARGVSVIASIGLVGVTLQLIDGELIVRY